MFEVKTPIDATVQKALSKNGRILAMIIILLGFILLVIHIINLSRNDIDFSVSRTAMMSFMLIFGLLFLFYLNKQVKALKKSGALVTNLYEFHEEFVGISSYKNNEVIATAKHYYSEFIKFKETDKLFFLFPNAQSAYPIYKDQLGKEQMDFIINLKATIKFNRKK